MQRFTCPTCAAAVFFDDLACVVVRHRARASTSTGDAMVAAASGVTCASRDAARLQLAGGGRRRDLVPLVPAGRVAREREGLARAPRVPAGEAAGGPPVPPLRRRPARPRTRRCASSSTAPRASTGSRSATPTAWSPSTSPRPTPSSARRPGRRWASRTAPRSATCATRRATGTGRRWWPSDAERLDRFRERFGDERADYAAALEAHYEKVDDGAWMAEHISHYASAHPWEDYAESFAQVLHLSDTLETGPGLRAER